VVEKEKSNEQRQHPPHEELVDIPLGEKPYESSDQKLFYTFLK